MTGLMYAHNLLVGVTQAYPTQGRQRHSLTIDEFGRLELTLFLGDHFRPIIFDHQDFKLGVDDLLAEIKRVMEAA